MGNVAVLVCKVRLEELLIANVVTRYKVLPSYAIINPSNIGTNKQNSGCKRRIPDTQRHENKVIKCNRKKEVT